MFKDTWIKAFQICSNFGLDLLTPDSLEDHNQLNKILLTIERKVNKEPYEYFSTSIGVTSHGIGNLWYSIDSGKILHKELEFMKLYDNRDGSSERTENSKFIRLKASDGKDTSYEAESGIDTKYSFICQRTLGPGTGSSSKQIKLLNFTSFFTQTRLKMI